MKEFGKIFGLSESAIGMYERNEREPDFQTLNNIANFFDVSIDYLLARSDESNSTNSNDDTKSKAFTNNPELQQWYKELAKSNELDLQRLRKIWNIFKDNE